eukprot:669734-Pelagomonas_calceolata.AAC.1
MVLVLLLTGDRFLLWTREIACLKVSWGGGRDTDALGLALFQEPSQAMLEKGMALALTRILVSVNLGPASTSCEPMQLNLVVGMIELGLNLRFILVSVLGLEGHHTFHYIATNEKEK